MMRLGFRAGVVVPLLLCGLLLPVVGFAAPLRDLSGHVRTIQDYTGKGKWLVVMIWASDCGACNAEAHNYVAFQKSHPGINATMLGISVDGLSDVEAAKAFVQRHDVNFPNLIGNPQDVDALYMKATGGDYLRGTPTFLIYNPQGKPVAAQLGAVPVSLIEQYIKDHSGKHGAPAGATGGSKSM